MKKEQNVLKTNSDDVICLNFESKSKYEEWMAVIIDIKRQLGDQKQLQESLQLALKLGIKSRKQEQEDESSSSPRDKG